MQNYAKCKHILIIKVSGYVCPVYFMKNCTRIKETIQHLYSQYYFIL